jgi:hypothetical protein
VDLAGLQGSGKATLFLTGWVDWSSAWPARRPSPMAFNRPSFKFAIRAASGKP